jgi:TonB family protein
MQPNDSRPRTRTPLPPPPVALGYLPPGAGADPPVAAAPAPLHLEAATLLIEARFRDITLASRVMRADQPGSFWIGPARRADAPVNPAWLPDPLAGHALVEQSPAGLTLNLAPLMRVELRTPVQRLAIPPDMGQVDRRLALPAGSHLRIDCGEVAFELRAIEAPPLLPRPRLPRGWRTDLRYLGGVALAVAVVLGIAHLIPEDPRALSLDLFGADHRADRMMTIPLDVATPVIDRIVGTRGAAGGGAQAARGPSGATGNRQSRQTDRRLAIKGLATPATAQMAAARIRTTGMLALLDGAKSSPLADVLANGPVLGADARDALGQMYAANIGDAYGSGGLSAIGVGSGGAGTGEGTIGTGRLNTMGRFGQGPGGDGHYGAGTGQLHKRQPHPPDIIIGVGAVTGSLDKEIIRREVRRHLNEVRYCYEQGLVRQPQLVGRLVVRFTIAATGRVLAAAPQSSTLGVASVENCVVQAVQRWQFPQPAGGGLAMVSYPFQFSPAGN